MKLAKYINGEIDLVEVENQHEVDGPRTEQELYALGYKKACLLYDNNGHETTWREYPTCFVEEEMINLDMEEMGNG